MDCTNFDIFSSPYPFYDFSELFNTVDTPFSIAPALTVGNFEPEQVPFHPPVTVSPKLLDTSPASQSSSLPDLYWSDSSSTSSPAPVEPVPLPSPRNRSKAADDEFIPDQDSDDDDDDDEYSPTSSSNPRKAGPSRKTKSRKSPARSYLLDSPSHASSLSASSASPSSSARASPSRKSRKAGPSGRVEAPNRNRRANDEESELVRAMIDRLSKDKASRGDLSNFHCPLPDCSSSRGMRAPDMKRHLKTHFGEKLFNCPACDKSFSRLDAVNRHLKNAKNVYCSRKLNSRA